MGNKKTQPGSAGAVDRLEREQDAQTGALFVIGLLLVPVVLVLGAIFCSIMQGA